MCGRKRHRITSYNVCYTKLLRLAAARTGTVIELSDGFTAWTDAQLLYMGRYPDVSEFEVPFVIGGETITPRGTLVSEFTDSWHIYKDGTEAFLDWEKLPKDLSVRSRREGDRFFPLSYNFV